MSKGRHGIMNHQPDFRSEADFTLDSCFQHAVVGAPQDCVEQLAMDEQEPAVDYVTMRFRLPCRPEQKRVLDCIQLFGEEGVPQFRG